MIDQLIKSGKSIKEFRGALLEASRNFVPGSAAMLIYNYYRAIRKYYSDLLIHEFQLYSDLPKTIFILTGVYAKTPERSYDFTFSAGKLTDLSSLQELNEVPYEDLSSVEMDFELTPELLYLVKEIQFDFNSELFTKDRNFSVGLGNGMYVTGSFKPQWNDKGLTISGGAFSTDQSTPAVLFNMAGASRSDVYRANSLLI